MESFLPLVLHYKYFILFPLALIEGPILSLFVGFLVSLGYLDVIPSYIMMVMGDVIPDSAYYFIGCFGKRKNFIEKYGSRVKPLANNFTLIERLWHHHLVKMMFIAKLAYGMSTALLISGGLVKVPFRKYALAALLVSLLQFGILMTVGYYLGYSYGQAEQYIKDFGYAIALGVVTTIVVYLLVQRYARSTLTRMSGK